ncbi:MAG: 4Fe-4S dicluster domain-containing protein [Bacillota bacterium]
MKKQNILEVKILKAILATYIILALVIAGLNYGYVDRAAPVVAEFISWLWHFYENWIKMLFIICGSFLTLKILSGSVRTAMRKRNLQGFVIFAFIVHILGPFVLGISELYLFSMPLPWTTTPLQLFYQEGSFYLSRFPLWGAAGISAALTFYFLISIVVLTGTLLLGRRWQCSTLCLFNGFASEVFSPAFPLTGKQKQITPGIIKLFSVLRWIFLVIALFFSFFWLIFVFGKLPDFNPEILAQIEVYKYLGTELLATMFLWIIFTGRGYCYYCPLGTVLSFIGKVAGQKIVTDKTECIKCNKCNQVCPLAIDIKSCAEKGLAVQNLRCVGCGHCVDRCPTKTLSYQTNFLGRIEKNRGI